MRSPTISFHSGNELVTEDRMATSPKSLSNLDQGSFVTLEKVYPAGTLQARKNVKGVTTFYWRCTVRGRDFREPIGAFDPRCPPLAIEPTSTGFSQRAAGIRASELARHHSQHLDIGGLPGYHRQQEREKQEANRAELQAADAQRLKQDEADRAEIARQKYNLKSLLLDYCDYLKALGRRSHSDARSIFTNHIFDVLPGIASKPAADVTADDIADMMRRLIAAGKDRTANKLRSYVRAAYQVARAAKSKPSIPLAFKAYGISGNPAAETSPDDSANRADKHPLSIEELRLYWSILQGVEGIKGIGLRLHLLSGGQRIAQLVRLRDEHVSDSVITIFDSKGRPGKPARAHSVPLTKAAKRELDACISNKPFRLSTDGGKTHLGQGNLGVWASEAVGEKIPDFLLKRVRSGVETALASAKVPKDIRGRLQSHGITGVQATHYDGHDYLDEKRECLELFNRLLNIPPKKTFQVPKRR